MRVERALAPVMVQLIPPPETDSAVPVSLKVKLPKLKLTSPNAQ